MNGPGTKGFSPVVMRHPTTPAEATERTEQKAALLVGGPWTLEEIEESLIDLKDEARAGALLDETIIQRLECFFSELLKDDPTLTSEHFWNVAEAVTGKRPDYGAPDCETALAQIIPAPIERSMASFRAFIRKEEEPL